MFEVIRSNQLNIMLVLCGACGILVFLLMITGFLSKSRRRILIMMEVMAFFLLWFDRKAYIYAGDITDKGYIMVRLSNLMVFMLTSAIVMGFNLYLSDLLRNEAKCATLPRRMFFTGAMSALGILMALVASVTNLYYYFDENNQYHRGPAFLIAYIIPVLCPILQYTVIRQYKKAFSRLIYASLVLYIFVPITCGVIQVFAYGISIVNMSMVGVSIFLYIFMYLDLNRTVRHAHEIEIQHMQGEQERMHRVFEQTAMAFVSAVEKKDEFTRGNAVRIAEYAKRIADLAGKSPEECEEVYYAALLHDVGLIGIPDKVIKNSEPDRTDYETIRRKPLIGEEILSCITEYPYLEQAAHYSHERYNGSGYPEGLKGEEIPEIARIIAVADAYVSMTTKKRYRDARPDFLAREAFVKGAGEEFDPAFAQIMISIIDADTNKKKDTEGEKPEEEIVCRNYREVVSRGIPVEENITVITFECEMPLDVAHTFAAPSVVLFDSFDQRTHDSEKTIESYHYLEYGEIWFDKHSITTEARKIEEKSIEGDRWQDAGNLFEIRAGRYEDHLRLVMRSRSYSKEVTVALPGRSKSAYIGLTGENCRLKHIRVEKTQETVGPGDIERLVEPVSYIDHLEADIRNVQIDRARSAYTEGVVIKNRLKLMFHTMSLPGASLIWHCPYIVLYSSDDGKVGGKNYREYVMIKLNGENDELNEYATNRFVMKKKDFPGWEEWKSINRKGMECEISFEKRGNRITLSTLNLGISIENTTTFPGEVPTIYAALSGDQVALTDIRTGVTG